MTTLKTHLFVCTKCIYRDAEDNEVFGEGDLIRSHVKEEVLKEHSKTDVRINKSGCLGKCHEGVTAVLYPEQKWFTELRLKDCDFLVDEIKKKLS